MFKSKHINSEKGVAIYLAIMVMTALLGIGFGISALFTNQLKVLRGIGDSVFAFYAADGGIERVLQVDSCINKIVESERLSCIRATINNPAFDDSNCKGSPTPDDPIANATECRKQAIVAIDPGSLNLSNGASYALLIKLGGSPCPGTNYCGESIGTFKQAVRKIQISR